jgi:DNA-directed RNA polymerase subunit alpha
MITVTCVESFIDKDQLHYGCFIIEPLNAGQALTVGNALRRTLLGDIIGTAITKARINTVKHEFSAISGVREDVLEILLNLKEIVFKSSIIAPAIVQLHATGPSIVTASQLIIPNHLHIVNPTQYIATVFESARLEIELRVEQGKGYKFADEKEIDSEFLLIDSVFSPIKRVNYKVKMIPTDSFEVKEALILEIWTNGSITPRRSLREATKFLIKLFYPILLNERKFFQAKNLNGIKFQENTNSYTIEKKEDKE